MDKNDFDVILDVNDPDFKQKFRDAIGAKPGEAIEVVTPQFERTDGVTPALSIDNWDVLRQADKETLRELGCCPWDETLMLFPWEWYDKIPDGYLVTSISGRTEPFVHGETDNDKRFGCLAYGVTVGGE